MLSTLSLANASETEAPGTPAGFGFIAIESNYVDGVVDPNEGVLGTNASGATDTYDYSISALLAGDRVIASSTSLDWNIGGSLYQENYRDFDIYNIGSANINTTVFAYLPDWRLRARLGHSKLWLDGDGYLNETEYLLGATWQLDKRYRLQARTRLIDVGAADREFLRHEGKVYEQQLQLKYRGTQFNWSIDVTARDENRNDLQFIFFTSVNPDVPRRGFTSYSHESWRWRLKNDWQWSDNWRQSLSFAVRDARYDDPDIYLTSAGSPRRVLRETQRIDLQLETSYSVSDSLNWLLR
ncbi:MAG: hypothetical protein HKO07_02840, partial [Pseudomonadales bacterium]|nr:hypothetical protein [Pseudomonadales bacterium]